MSSASWDPDPERVTAEILAGDRSQRGWRRNAVGMPREQALAQIPAVGVLQCKVPIKALAQLQAHIALCGVNQATWLREAAVARYLAEGGDPAVGAELSAMARTIRRGDWVRGQQGQSRRRQGRRGDPPEATPRTIRKR